MQLGEQVSMRLIVLDRRGDVGPHHRNVQAGFWVADETASCTLAIYRTYPHGSSPISPGDIFWLRNGQVRDEGEGRLSLSASANSRLEKAGFLTLSFLEEPDVSMQCRSNAKKEVLKAGDFKGQGLPGICEDADAKQHSAARRKLQEAKNPGGGNMGGHSGKQADSGGAPSQSRCFICGEASHAVSSCPEHARGVFIKCASLDKLDKTERSPALFKALHEFGLPAAEHLQWYKAGSDLVGKLYARFASARDVAALKSCKEFCIDGDPAKVFDIGAQSAKRSRTPIAAISDKRRRTEEAKSTPGLPKASPVIAPARSSGDASVSDRPCELCASVSHNGPQCQYWKQSLEVRGAQQQDIAPLKGFLLERSIVVEDVRWSDCRCFMRLRTPEQVQQACEESRSDSMIIDGRHLSFVALNVVESCPSVKDCSEDVSTERQKRQAPKGVNRIALAKASSPHHPVAGQCCPLCLSSDHVWSACERLACSLQVWKAQPDAITAAFQGLNAPPCHLQFHGNRGYVVLDTLDTVQKVLAVAREQGGLMVPGTNEKVKVFPLSERKSSESRATKTNEKVKAFPVVPADSCKCCFLCGSSEHELPACTERARCVVICREWGATSLRGESRNLTDPLWGALKSAEVSVERLYWHKQVCYVQLSTPKEAKRLIAGFAATGLRVSGEVLRVRPARSTRINVQEGDSHTDVAVIEAPAGCPLCASLDHDLISCVRRSLGVIIRCEAFAQAEGNCEDALVSALLETGSAKPEVLRWSAGAFYATMPSDADVEAVLGAAVGEGVEINGCMACIERVMASSSAARVSERLPGLAPQMRGFGKGKRTKGSNGKDGKAKGSFSKGSKGKDGKGSKGKAGKGSKGKDGRRSKGKEGKGSKGKDDDRSKGKDDQCRSAKGGES